MQEKLNSKGYFNYMTEGSSSSLYRNSKVLTRRDLNGSDAGSEGIDLKKYEQLVINARDLSSDKKISLDRNGFELISSNLDNFEINFFNNNQVLHKYYNYCANEIKDFTGANKVFAFDHNIRSASGKKTKKMIDGGQQVQGPAHIVHGDYTLTSAPERLKQLSFPPGKNDTLNKILGADSLLSTELVKETLLNGRFAIINLWRNIVLDPVEVNPLALCDAQTVTAEDLVVFEIHYSDRIGENYFAKHNSKHKWYYYPYMTMGEALLIKQWDSSGGLAKSSGKFSDSLSKVDTCTFSFHSAFNDANTRLDAPDRWSMEVRCIVIY